METKQYISTIKSKDGDVNTTYMQKHMPSADMCLVITTSNNFLFVQKDHPLFVMDDKKHIIEIEVKDINISEHKLWVDNSALFNKNKYTPKQTPEYIFNLLFSDKHVIPELINDIIRYSKTYKQYIFNSKFANIDTAWIQSFLKLIKNNTSYIIKIRCIYLLEQLKLLSDRVNYYFDFITVDKSDDVYFIPYVDYKYDHIPNIIEQNTSYVKDYKNIKNIITINNWKYPVYDIKTDTKHFMMNAVENHNSFHCIHKDMETLIRFNDIYGTGVYTLEKLWEKFKNNYTPIQTTHHDGTQEEIIIPREINLKVWDRCRFTRILKIIRHKKPSNIKMNILKTENNKFIICQENHPNMVIESNEYIDKKNKGECRKLYELETGSLGNNLYLTDCDYPIFSMYTFSTMSDTKEQLENILEHQKIPDNYIHFNDDILFNVVLSMIQSKHSNAKLIDIGTYYNSIHIEINNLITMQRMISILNKLNIINKVELNNLYIYHNQNTIINLSDISTIELEAFSKMSDFNNGPMEIITSVTEYPMDEDDYVYDLTTESGTLTVNGIWTHNTGGAVILHKVDIIKQFLKNLDDSNEKFLRSVFTQTDNDLILKTDDARIEIDKFVYSIKYKIEEDDKYYILPLGYFVIKLGGFEFPVTIEQETLVYKTSTITDNNNSIIIEYKKNDAMLVVEPKARHAEKVAASLDELVAGKSPMTTTESLLYKFHEKLSPMGGYDLTHLEVILGTIIRNKIDPQVPARLKTPYNPVMFSIKSLPSEVSPKLGLAYENIGRALVSGMIHKDTDHPSDIERVLFGHPLSEISKDQLKQKKKNRNK